MNKETFAMIENYMISCMNDSAHDKEHIYRVLYNALRIAKTEENINYDILISACLLHDISKIKSTSKYRSKDFVWCGQIRCGRCNGNCKDIDLYKYKLEKIYTNFYTEEGMKMALERQKSAIDFYDSLFGEVRTTYEAGQEELEELLKIW